MNSSFRRWAAGLSLGLLAILISGCSPQAMALLLLPFVDDKIPAEYPLANSKKEVTVAVMASYGSPPLEHELIPADNELAEKFVVMMRKRCAENKEKIKFIPNVQVRGYQTKMSRAVPVAPVEVGKHFKVDYVIDLEIDSLSIYEKLSNKQLYRGNAEITMNLYDMSKPEGEHKVHEKPYRVEYPNARGPRDASEMSPNQFRGEFLMRVARDLTRTYVAYPSEQKFDID